MSSSMQRRRKVEPRNGIGIQFVPVFGQLRNIDSQRFYIILCAFDVRAGFRIAPFRKACHGVNGGFLREGKLARAGEHQIVQVVAVEFVFELVGNAIAHQRGAERLGYVILRAQRKALGLVSFFILRRNEHNRDVAGLRIATQTFADFVTVHTGHDDVKQDQVWRGLPQGQTQGIRAVFGKHDCVFVAQAFTENAQVFRRVIHKQDDVAPVYLGWIGGFFCPAHEHKGAEGHCKVAHTDAHVFVRHGRGQAGRSSAGRVRVWQDDGGLGGVRHGLPGRKGW